MGKYKSQEKYDATNTRQIRLKLNKGTDKDVLEWLEKQESKQGAIKELIRAQIEKEDIMDIMKIDIRELEEKAQRFFEESDEGALRDFFGDCKTIEEINATANDLYDEFFDE